MRGAVLVTMAVVYFVFVLPITKARAMTADPEEEAAEEVAAEVALLTEIRDLLSERRDG